MLREPQKNDEFADSAIVHLIVGLLKSDPDLGDVETRKAKLLIYKFRHGLPGSYDEMSAQMEQCLADADYKSWKPFTHLERAFGYFDKYVELGLAKSGHIQAVIDLLEVVMEVGEITPEEKQYLDRVTHEFAERYGK